MAKSFPKPNRVINLALIRRIRKMACMACDVEPPFDGNNDAAHLQTVGSGGPDTIDNLVPLCRACHGIQHRIGLKSFAERYKLPVTWENGYPRRSDLIDEP